MKEKRTEVDILRTLVKSLRSQIKLKKSGAKKNAKKKKTAENILLEATEDKEKTESPAQNLEQNQPSPNDNEAQPEDNIFGIWDEVLTKLTETLQNPTEIKSKELKEKCSKLPSFKIEELLPQIKDRINTTKQEIKTLFEQYREKKKELKTNPEIVEKIAEIYQKAKDLKRNLRKEFSREKGLYWGTYLVVEAATRQASKKKNPRFRPYNGEGHLAIQFQNGLSPDSLFKKNDLIYLEKAHASPKTKKALREYRLHFCVSRNKKEIMKAVLPLVYHREIPENGRVKWAHLIRRKVGAKYIYYVCFSVELDVASGIIEEIVKNLSGVKRGVAAVDIGWKLTENGLRAAYLVDDKGYKEELIIPKRYLERIEFADSLHSIRDRRFEEIKGITTKTLSELNVPNEIAERLKHLQKIRSRRKFLNFYKELKQSHPELNVEVNKETIEKLCPSFAQHDLLPPKITLFELIEGGKTKTETKVHTWGWWAVENHLFEMESNIRNNYKQFRNYMYECFSAKLAKQYDIVLLPEMDYSKLAQKNLPEKGVKYTTEADHLRFLCAPYVLQMKISAKTNAIKMKSAHYSRICSVCKFLNDQNVAKKPVFRCKNCNNQMDIDENSCKNILATYLSPDTGGTTNPGL
ncbi:MAG: hypothetical protein C4321_03020 [Chloroflexota bacterium]